MKIWNIKMGHRRVYRYLPYLCIGVVLVVFYIMPPSAVLFQEVRQDLDADMALPSTLDDIGSFKEPPEIDAYFNARKSLFNFSELGSYLFVDFKTREPRKYSYTVLIWHGDFLQNRHIKHFGKESHDPFEFCSVDNCQITINHDDVEKADAIVFLLHRMKSPADLPEESRRLPGQRWIFLTDESPHHTFLMAPVKNWKLYNGLFNWSMSYRLDADIPVPYGRTTKLKQTDIFFRQKERSRINDLIPNFKEKRSDVLVAVLISNCKGSEYRAEYIEELKKFIRVDMYGGCGNMKKECPGHFKEDCPALDGYLFYLAFENSQCEQYITEKAFYNGYHKGAIPVILGTTRTSAKILLPPKSYLHVDDFARPSDLAMFISFLNGTGEYLAYHEWRRMYAAANEHGYFQTQSFHYCRVCEALNYNSLSVKVYSNLSLLLDPSKSCSAKS